MNTWFSRFWSNFWESATRVTTRRMSTKVRVIKLCWKVDLLLHLHIECN